MAYLLIVEGKTEKERAEVDELLAGPQPTRGRATAALSRFGDVQVSA